MLRHLPVPRWGEQLVLASVLAGSWLLWRAGDAEPTTRPVLVYLANETRPSAAGGRNAEIVEGWLRASGDPAAREAAERLAEDRAQFPAAVDRDVQALLGLPGTALLAATNDSIRAGCVWLRTGDDEQLASALPFPAPPASGDVVVDDSPLANRVVLKQLLGLVGERFPVERHHFIVLVKSHGVGELVLTPRLTVRHERSSPEDVLARVRGEVGAERVLDGVRRDELFEDVETAGLPVRLLVLNVCGAGQGLRAGDLPVNVRTVAAADDSVGYDGLALEDLGQDPVGALLRQIDRHPTLRRIEARRPILFFVLAPVFVLGIVVARALRQRAPTPSPGAAVGVS